MDAEKKPWPPGRSRTAISPFIDTANMLALTATAIVLALANSASADGLNKRGQRESRPIYFGTAIKTDVLSSSAVNAIAVNNGDFGSYTCENEMKIMALEPNQNQFTTYGPADAIVAQAEANNMTMRCHTLVWYKSLPTWVTAGSWTNATLTAAMVNHITNVVTHFKGKCYAWDVVNEAINNDGTYRNLDESTGSIWYRYIGPAYIPIAFQAAHDADPGAKLYYNDYAIEKPGAKANGAIAIVQYIQSYGAPIDGVGLQGHFTSGAVPTLTQLVASLQAFAALGVEVAYTELDVATPSTSPNFAQQAIEYASVVTACQIVSACVGITVWEFADAYSYAYSAQLPDLWDTNLQKKPAYYSTLQALGPDPTVDSCGCASF